MIKNKLFIFTFCVFAILFSSAASFAQDSKSIESSLDFQYKIKKEVTRRGLVEAKKIYVLLDEEHFSQEKLRVLFNYISNREKAESLRITVFSKEEYLDKLIEAENYRVNFDGTPEERKAQVEYFKKEYPPETGYFRAFYNRHGSIESFKYSPKKEVAAFIVIPIDEVTPIDN